MSEESRLLTTREVALRLQCSVWTVSRMVKRGKLKAIRWGRGRRFRAHDLERFLSAQEERIRR